MKPLNQAERNSAFLAFLLFFVVTIGLVILVVFFSVDVPFRQNKQLRNLLAAKQTEKALSDSFYTAMKDAMYVLSQYDNSGKEPLSRQSAINRTVQMKIDEMNRIVKYFPAGDSSIYALAVDNLTALNEAKATVRRVAYESR